MAAEGVSFVTNAHVGMNVPVEDLHQRVRRDPAGGRLGTAARLARFRDASSRASTSRWSSCRNRIGGAKATRSPRNRHPGHGQARGDHRRRRHGRRLPGHHVTGRRRSRFTSSKLCRCRRERAPHDAVAAVAAATACGELARRRRHARLEHATQKFTGDENGNVKQLHAIRVGPPPKFEPIAGTEFTIEADLVLLAMGFTGPVRNGMLEQFGVRARCARQRGYRRKVQDVGAGLFAAGDMRRGQSLVVWAIAEGRKTAGCVDAWLRTKQ